MKLINRFLLLSLIAVLSLTSCEDESINSTALLGLEFYPVEEGRSWTYQVDSLIIFREGNNRIESTSFIRENITGSFVNGSGDTTYILTISESETLEGTFRIKDTWSIEKSRSSVIRYEENLGFLKLTFPLTECAQPNIIDCDEIDNILFDQQLKLDLPQFSIQPYTFWGYRVLNRGRALTVGGMDFINVTTIQQADNQLEFTNDLNQRKVIEQYAPNVGLIQRTMEIFNTDCGTECRDQPWEEKADFGFSLVQTLVAYN